MLSNSSGPSSPWPAPPDGRSWRCTAARPSAPRGWCWPPSVPTSSPTASTAGSWPPGVLGAGRPPGHPGRAPRQRPGLRADLALGALRSSLRRHRRAPGPLVGPVLAAQFGYLPGTIWIVFGVVLGGAVQDFVILFASMRRDGKSLGQMAKEEIGPGHGIPRHGRGAGDHGHPAGGPRARGGERAEGQPLGRVHHRLHHPHRAADGLLDEGLAAGAGRSRRRSSVWRSSLAALVGGRYVAASPVLAPCVHLVGHHHRLRGDRLRLRRERAAGLDAALSPGLPLDVHESRHHPAAGAAASWSCCRRSRCPP